MKKLLVLFVSLSVFAGDSDVMLPSCYPCGDGLWSWFVGVISFIGYHTQYMPY